MAGRTVWDDTARAEDLEVLRRGAADALDRTPDVLVVGGGIVGLATAAMCRRAGLGSVVVVEREQRLASGTSGSAWGGLGPDTHALDPAPFPSLARRSLELHRELEAEWDGDLGLEDLDLIATMSGPEASELASSMGAGLLGPDDLAALAPELADTARAGLRFGSQPRVHPLRLAAAFARRAGTLAAGVEVTGWEVSGGRVRAVCTSAGDVSPGNVVLASGLAPSWAVGVPQELVKGHLVATAPAPFRLSAAFTTGEIGVLQTPDGRIVAGGTLDEGDTEDVVRSEVADRIRALLVALLPAAAPLEITHRWCCFRPATADRLPVIDRAPGTDNAWITCGHYRTGLLNAPAAGEAIASWIASGRPPDGVARWAVSRFG